MKTYAYFEVRPCIECAGDVQSFADHGEFMAAVSHHGSNRNAFRTFWTLYGRFWSGDVYLADAIADRATEADCVELMHAIQGPRRSVFDAGLCVWEEMLARETQRDGTEWAKPMLAMWKEYGTCDMRDIARELAPLVEAGWLSGTDDDRDGVGPFDWEFVPAFLSRIVWTSEGYEPFDPVQTARAVFDDAPTQPGPEGNSALEALKTAEEFIRGFEGDELQDGIEAKLAAIRAAIAEIEGR